MRQLLKLPSHVIVWLIMMSYKQVIMSQFYYYKLSRTIFGSIINILKLLEINNNEIACVFIVIYIVYACWSSSVVLHFTYYHNLIFIFTVDYYHTDYDNSKINRSKNRAKVIIVRLKFLLLAKTINHFPFSIKHYNLRFNLKLLVDEALNCICY